MEKYEYVVRGLQTSNYSGRSPNWEDPLLQDFLNEMGATGYRLVGFTAVTNGLSPSTYTVILERPVEVEE